MPSRSCTPACGIGTSGEAPPDGDDGGEVTPGGGAADGLGDEGGDARGAGGNSGGGGSGLEHGSRVKTGCSL